MSNANILLIIQITYRHLFDGIIFDTPLTGYTGFLPFDIVYFLDSLSNRLHEEDKSFILTLMVFFPFKILKLIYFIKINDKAAAKKGPVLEKLLRLSDKLLLCTYDYGTSKYI